MFRLDAEIVDTRAFLGAARKTAEALPPGRFVLNLCRDRLPFALALAAAMLRGQVTLLSSDRSVEWLQALSVRFPGVYAVADYSAPPGQQLAWHLLDQGSIRLT